MMRPGKPIPIPADTAALGQMLLRETDPYRVIGEHLADLLDDTVFAALYPATGRIALAPSLLALVTIFQFLENLPDRDAAHAVVVRLDWKYALHLPLDSVGFHFTDLHYFRQRLLDQQQERLVFETILNRIRALGLVRKRGKQRTDALAVLGAVRDLSRLELVTETMRLAVQAIERTDPHWWEQTAPAGFRDLYGQTRSDYGLSADEVQTALRQVGHDGFWVLEHLAATGTAASRALAEVATLTAVWAQQYRQTNGAITLPDPEVTATELILTPHDPEVRVGEKRGHRWHGEKVHLTETAEEGEVHFLTDVTTTPASSGDAAALPLIRQQLATRDLLPAEQYVDAGYVSGQQLAQSQADGITLQGPPLLDTSPQEFKIAHFAIDRATHTALCPAGHPAVKWSPRTERDGSAAINIRFAAADCAACLLRERCTTSRGGRSVHLNEHYDLLQARRHEAQTDAFRATMHLRAGIEATISEMVRSHGLRHHRYRGTQKRPFENLLKGAACNFKRLVRVLARGVASPVPSPPSFWRPPRPHAFNLAFVHHM